MKLWLPGRPGVHESPTHVADRARQALGPVEGLPVYAGPVAVRLRFIFEFPGTGEQPTPEQRATFDRARPTTLAWYYCHALEGLMWKGSEQVTSLYAAKEFGRVSGVEVIA